MIGNYLYLGGVWEGMGKNLRYLIIAIGIFLVFICFFWTEISDIWSGTNPDELLIYDYGVINYAPQTALSFEDYYSLVVPDSEEFIEEYKNFSFALEIPELETIILGKEYLDSCESKKVEIDFSNPKYNEFEFNYESNKFNYKINLYNDLYYFSDNLKEQDCYYRKGFYERYFLDPYNNNLVKLISEDFISLREKGFSDNELVEIATLFVQSIHYGTDKSDLNRYPYETMYEKEGNCYDKSILLAGILKNLGYEVYALLGDSEEEYHAIIGLVCEDGNMVYNGKNICFIETTVFYPIASESDIKVDEFIEVSPEGKIYREVRYGKSLANKVDDKTIEAEEIILEMDTLDVKLLEIEEEMCETDCLDCESEVDDIKYCDDAYEYNRLGRRYNNIIEDYNVLIEDYYKIYYDLEKDLFWNLELMER